MKFGVCTSVENAVLAKQAGFDFIECSVTSLMEKEFNEIINIYEHLPIPVEACNVFLPGDIKVTGESVDWPQIKSYLENAMPRVKHIGANVVVFGSGRSRSFPANITKEKAEEQLIQFLHIVADYAEEYGITVVIEPLNTKESNIITSVAEALMIARKVERDSIKVLADFYHMEEENEAIDNIVLAGDYLHHIHVADTGRLAPGTGVYPYADFARAVSNAKYEGRISIECRWNDLDKELKASYKFLEKMFQVKV